jgi:hypothetical protein
MSFDRKLFDCEGPLGFPLQDRQAHAVEALLKTLPRDKEYAYRRLAKAGAATELNPGERSDVSWISTEALDRDNQVVLARGMNDSQFSLNPVVTLNHCYYAPPVGRSLWRKRVKDGPQLGIKAKTQYPPAPADWNPEEPWAPDRVFALIQANLLNAKSIGFLPLKVHYPDAAEAGQRGWPSDTLVIDEWLLLEYAVCPFGTNPEATVEAVSKAGPLPAGFLEALGIKSLPAMAPAAPGPPVRFTALTEIEAALAQRLGGLDLTALAMNVVARARGRI